MDNLSIINAAYVVFGRNGYRKASIGDIASLAEVAKSAVFYHYGSKEKLYFYLVDFGAKLMYEKFAVSGISETRGFFERLKLVSICKLEVMREFPGMLAFFRSIMSEDDPSILPRLEAFKKGNVSAGLDFFMQGLDSSSFRDDVDPDLLFRFIAWATEGGVNSLPPLATQGEVDKFSADFYAVIDLMRKYFYKE